MLLTTSTTSSATTISEPSGEGKIKMLVTATPRPHKSQPPPAPSSRRSIAWPRKQVISRLFSSVTVPVYKVPATPSTEAPPQSIAQSLGFDCLYLIFSALDDLESSDPTRLPRSSDPVRAYLYEPFELEDSAPGRWQLMSCSLVCKAWSLPAQLRMLRHTKLHLSSQAGALINYLASVGDSNGDGFGRPDKTIANHVQVLELGIDAPPHAGCCYASASEHHDWLPSRRRDAYQNLTRWQTFDVLRRCHRVQQLTLSHWRPDDLRAAMDPRSPYLPPISFDVLGRHQPFERLTTLRLHRFSGSFRSLYDLLALTPKLTSFSFEGAISDSASILRQLASSQSPSPPSSLGPASKRNVSPSNNEGQSDGDPFTSLLGLGPVPFSLTRLSVGGYQSSFLIGFSWLLAQSWSTLERLDLGRCPSSASPAVESLLVGLEKVAKEGKSKITHLSVTLSPGVDTPRMIRACPSLRALRIDGTPPVSALALNRPAQDAPVDGPAGAPDAAGVPMGPALGAAILAAQQRQQARSQSANPAASSASTIRSGTAPAVPTANEPPPLPATMRALHLYACLNALSIPLFALNLCFLSSPRSSSSHSTHYQPSRPSSISIRASSSSNNSTRMSIALTASPLTLSPPTSISLPSSAPSAHPSFPPSASMGSTTSTSPTNSYFGTYSSLPFSPVVASSFKHTHHAPPPSQSSSHGTAPPGRSPSAREMALLTHLLTYAPNLRRLWSISLEFAPRMAFPDAPLNELRAIRDVCDRVGVGLSMPDLYDLVLGWTGAGSGADLGIGADGGAAGGGGGGRTIDGRSRHTRFFSMSGL